MTSESRRPAAIPERFDDYGGAVVVKSLEFFGEPEADKKTGSTVL